jgi:hypothetical protein
MMAAMRGLMISVFNPLLIVGDMENYYDFGF